MEPFAPGVRPAAPVFASFRAASSPCFAGRSTRFIVMLSYRHAFHAGNHADVLKHAIVVQMLRYLGLKDKPYW